MEFIDCTLEQHGEAILAILNDAIVHSTALYDYRPRTLESMVTWFAAKRAGRFPIIGVMDGHALAGFASYGTFRAWPAYKYSIEHSVYVHPAYRRRGVGRALMTRLIAAATGQQYHAMIGGIDVENAASIALHAALGFTHAGTIRQAGFKFGRWLDLAFYQLLLDTPDEPVDG